MQLCKSCVAVFVARDHANKGDSTRTCIKQCDLCKFIGKHVQQEMSANSTKHFTHVNNDDNCNCLLKNTT